MENKERLLSSAISFLTQPGEKLIFIVRKHVFLLEIRIALILLFLLLTLTMSLLLFFSLNFPIPLLLVLNLAILTFSLHILSKSIADWYFHIYIVTTHKILEVFYAPLFSHVVNEVLLDQIRCTEIDIQTEGIISELINMGDVMLTFDRPTHQEQFCLMGIENPQKVGTFLGDKLLEKQGQVKSGDAAANVSKETGSWYKVKSGLKKLRFTEELFPNHISRIGGAV